MIKNPLIYKTNYYYSLQEVYNWLNGEDIDFETTTLGETLDNVEGCFDTAIYPEHFTTQFQDNKYKDFWKMIVARYGDEFIFVNSKEEDLNNPSEEFCNNIRAWFKKFITTLLLNQDKYLTLVDFYTNEKATLLRKLSNEVSMKYNDTPQDEGSFVGDVYMTTFTKTTTEVDNDTPMARLREVQDNYKNLLHEWSNEFACLFMEDYNL